MLESIQYMLSSLDNNDIKYCHWKSNEHLDDSLEGDTDLDILFLSEQRNEIDKILASCNLKRFRSTELMHYNAIEDFIGFDQKTGKIWHLHAHYKLTFGEKHLKGYTMTQLGETVICNRIRHKSGIYISAYEDELILFFIRNAMKFRWRDILSKINHDDLLELKWLLKYSNHDKIKEYANRYFNNETAKLIVLLSGKNVTKKIHFYKLQKLLRKDLKLFTGYTIYSSWVMRSKREIYWLIGAIKRYFGFNTSKPTRRISPSGGSVIVFLGSDGSGKSTTIKKVKKEFSKKIDVKTVYLGSGDGSSSLLRIPMRIIAKQIGGRGIGYKIESRSLEQNKRISNLLKSKLYSLAKIIWAITLAQEKKKKLKIITKSRNNGMLVLVDRYPQTLIMGYNDGPLLSKYLSKGHGLLYLIAQMETKIYQSAYINPPDLTFKLKVSPELAIIRKPEMTIDEIENKMHVVMQMTPSKKIKTVDTSVDINESFKIVMNEIWKII